MAESIVTDSENWRYSEYLMPCSYNGHICDKKQLKKHPIGLYLCIEHYEDFDKFFVLDEGKHLITEEGYIQWQKIYAKAIGEEVDEAEIRKVWQKIMGNSNSQQDQSKDEEI